jgi:hypothetical protein
MEMKWLMSVEQFVEWELARDTELLGENMPSATSFIESYKSDVGYICILY